MMNLEENACRNHEYQNSNAVPLLPPIFTDVTQIGFFFILVKTRNTLSQKSREAKKGREWET